MSPHDQADAAIDGHAGHEQDGQAHTFGFETRAVARGAAS